MPNKIKHIFAGLMFLAPTIVFSIQTEDSHDCRKLFGEKTQSYEGELVFSAISSIPCIPYKDHPKGCSSITKFLQMVFVFDGKRLDGVISNPKHANDYVMKKSYFFCGVPTTNQSGNQVIKIIEASLELIESQNAKLK